MPAFVSADGIAISPGDAVLRPGSPMGFFAGRMVGRPPRGG
jgi:hypothetical protein